MNLGIRWDANIDFLVPQLGNDQANSNKGVWDLQQVMHNPNFPTNDPGAQTITSIVGNTGNLQKTTADWKEFQPRVGFAWDITGTGKHLLRGGYGIARDQIFQNLTLFSIQQTQPIIYQTVFDNTSSECAGRRQLHQSYDSGKPLHLPVRCDASAGSSSSDADGPV